DPFTFDVKLHQLFSFHSTTAKLLPPDLQQRAEVDQKGKVRLTPKIEEAMFKAFLGPISILRATGKMGGLFLQLSPASSPRKHKLDQLKRILAAFKDYEIAVEFRNRNWVVGEQLGATTDFLC